ncbi:hypothetical protein PR048_025978 [Dryococelus australis]|uniref:HTH psq-type domain-containing protein n=1 Tax=Dryococelus australis TaxID=614101 RepID=A0ABQ9GK34_9NEOP|nr:hypothetical protein PR048_025978 [Dryococelus australis]
MQGGRSDAVVRLRTPHNGQLGSIPSRATPGFLHVGLMPNSSTVRRVFSGLSHRPCPCIPALLHIHLTSLSSALKAKCLNSTSLCTVHHCHSYMNHPQGILSCVHCVPVPDHHLGESVSPQDVKLYPYHSALKMAQIPVAHVIHDHRLSLLPYSNAGSVICAVMLAVLHRVGAGEELPLSKKAVDHVKQHRMSLREAAEVFGVPKSTIQRRVSGKNTGIYRCPRILSDDDEKALTDGIVAKTRRLSENINRARSKITSELIENYFVELGMLPLHVVYKAEHLYDTWMEVGP